MLYRIIRAIPSSYHTMEDEAELSFRLQTASSTTFDLDIHDEDQVGPNQTIWDNIGLFRTREAAIAAIVALSTPPEYFSSENPNVPLDHFPEAA